MENGGRMGFAELVLILDYQRSSGMLAVFFLVKRARGTYAIKQLLCEALSEWLSCGDLAKTIDVVAIAISTDGENMLRRFGFHRCKSQKEAVHGYAVFARFDVNVEDLKIQWNELLGNHKA